MGLIDEKSEADGVETRQGGRKRGYMSRLRKIRCPAAYVLAAGVGGLAGLWLPQPGADLLLFAAITFACLLAGPGAGITAAAAGYFAGGLPSGMPLPSYAAAIAAYLFALSVISRRHTRSRTRAAVLQELLEKTPSGVCLVKGQDLERVFENSAYRQLASARTPAAPGHGYPEFHGSQGETLLRQSMETRVRHSLFAFHSRNGDRELWWNIDFIPVGRDEVMIAAVDVSDEIAARELMKQIAKVSTERGDERKRLEEALRESENKKDEFLSILAHELRNPLAAMSVGVSLLRRAKEGMRLDMIVEALEERTKQLARLLDDLLDVSRITRGKITLEKHEIDLRDVAELAADTSGELMRQRQHTLSLTLPDEPAPVLGDAVRLEQAVVNLLTNAAKYTERGGEIRLSVENRPEEVLLAVQDTGVGIPEGEQARVFELFGQGKETRARGGGGLGIGLALVQKLTEMHGGRVELQSTPGAGSTFVLHLPRLTATQHPEPHEEWGEPEPGLRVLIAQSTRANALAAAAILQQHGHTVELAFDGQMALTFAQRTRPDIILLDLDLPDLGGCEVAQKMRRDLNLYESLLISTGGAGPQRDREACRTAGFDRHLSTPVRYEVLAPLIREWRERRRTLGDLGAHVT